MTTLDDLEFLLWNLDEMGWLGPIIGVEEELQQLRGAVNTARIKCIGDLGYMGLIGAINERADALLEKIRCWHERHRSSGTSSSSLVVKAADAITRCGNKIKFPRTIASELKKLISQYQAVRSFAAYSGERGTHPKPEAPGRIVGRDEDVEKIITRIDQLRQQGEEDGQNLHIIPIVGIPGVGKTTVAQMVYAHPLAADIFDQRIWLHFSPYFDIEGELKRAVNFLPGIKPFHDGEDEDYMHILKGKLLRSRYLLVLDDVWIMGEREKARWDGLKELLLDIRRAQGIVIVTTSSHDVAEMMMADNSDSPYELQGLSEADCLKLFHQLLQEQELPLPQGEDKEVVHKIIQEKIINGLPLEVLNLTKNFVVDKNYVPSLISRRIQNCYDSVSWRYVHLPIYLRHRFRFCSLFPQDYNYDMEELGEIWRAQHYVTYIKHELSSELHLEPRNYAEQWKDCFFLDSIEDKVTYKMHYSMHQFAKHLTRGTYQTMIMRNMAGSLHNPHEWLHLSLLVDSETSAFPKVSSSLKNLRTLILLREPQMVLSNHKCKFSKIALQLFKRMKLLCVLDLQYTVIRRLPRTVGKLLNLRYLNLSGTDITTLPRCIGKLQSLMFLKLVNCKYLRRLNDDVGRLGNLRKLDIAGCHSLVRVPDRIDDMRQLRCINNKDCSSMIQMPYCLGQLTNLHTLPRYIVGDNDGYTISELQNLTRLEGELRVENLQNVGWGFVASTAELWNKKKLKSLTLQWNWWKHGEEAKDTEAIQDVLEELRPNENLIKLEIISYMGKQFPRWMREPYLAFLEDIKLFNLKLCETLPPLGVLPRLMVAEISGMDAITRVDDAFYGANGTFPSLQRLTFSQMLNLEKWSDVERRNMFPCLTKLTIINCPQMVALEMELPSVTELAMWLNNERLYNSKGGLKGLAGSLKKFSISLCEQLLESSECEGLQELRSLEEIEISGCQELTKLPRGIRQLKSLKSLTITCCNKMRSSPNWSNDELTSLCTLSINGCNLLPNNPPEHS